MSETIMNRLSKQASEAPILDQSNPADVLKRLLATEYQAVTMYNCAYYRVRGKERMDLIPEYKAHKDEEADHAEILEELLMEYGGITFADADEWKVFSPTEVPSVDSANDEVINAVIEKSEEEAVALYTVAVQFFESIGDASAAAQLKEILKDEKEHLKDVRIDFQGKDSAV